MGAALLVLLGVAGACNGAPNGSGEADGGNADDADADDTNGGNTDGGDTDGPAALCLKNPTFAGDPTAAPGIGQRTSQKLPDWQVCGGRVDVNPGFCTLPAPSGTMTYLGLPEGYAAFQYATTTSVSTALAATLPAGSYPFSIDIGVAVSTLLQGGFGVAGGAPVELAVYGSSSPCGQDQLLARTMSITNTDSWVSYSLVLAASQPFSNLVLVPTLSPSESPGHAGAYVIVGDIVSSPSCQ